MALGDFSQVQLCIGQSMYMTICLTLQQLASHGLMNVMVEAEGDTWIDDHHTCEDIGTPLQDL